MKRNFEVMVSTNHKRYNFLRSKPKGSEWVIDFINENNIEFDNMDNEEVDDWISTILRSEFNDETACTS